WRGRIGSLDWLRECCEPPACPCQRARTRNGDSARARGGASAIDATVVDREFAAFSFRRNRRFGNSVLFERFSAAAGAREFALSLVLMIAAGLLLRSFWDLLNVQLGFTPQNVISVRTRLPEPNDPKVDKYAAASQEAPFIRELIHRCAMLSGVEEVAIGDTASIPLDESLRDLKLISEGQFLLTVEGRDVQSDHSTVAERSSVSPNYFHLLGIPLLRGRLFNELDNDKTPQVAVINQAMAQSYWPNEDPLGKRFKAAKAGASWITVVGVIANARTQSLAQADLPQIYLDLYQTGAKRLAILLRGRLHAAAISDEVREQVQALDPTLPVSGAETLNETVSASLAQRRFSMEM